MKRLTAVDAKAMAAIHAESFERSWDALEMAAHSQNDMCYGLKTAGNLAAFIILRAAAGQAEILTIATHPDFRRSGWGQKILTQAARSLKDSGCDEIFLEVAEDNTAAIALYKNAGFAPIGRRPGYYRDHPDAEEVYTRASKKDPKISLATVYRTVRLFDEAGIIETHFRCRVFSDHRCPKCFADVV